MSFKDEGSPRSVPTRSIQAERGIRRPDYPPPRLHLQLRPEHPAAVTRSASQSNPGEYAQQPRPLDSRFF